MADAATQLQALEDAIASGLLRFTFEGKTHEYRSLDDMLRVREILARKAGVATGGGIVRTVAAYRRGT
ncbi:phage head-tail joining protein [Oleispirillum naphthae]|uniref:phage head-tail joining protein n=1 Tax=Oleispirillum naphthae TaxID=2838853 RepID=UPI003082582E